MGRDFEDIEDDAPPSPLIFSSVLGDKSSKGAYLRSSRRVSAFARENMKDPPLYLSVGARFVARACAVKSPQAVEIIGITAPAGVLHVSFRLRGRQAGFSVESGIEKSLSASAFLDFCKSKTIRLRD